MANLYAVIYQIRKPAPAPSPGQGVANGNQYVRDPRHATILSNDNGPGIVAAIKNNVTLASGEVIDILRVSQSHAAGVDGVWQ